MLQYLYLLLIIPVLSFLSTIVMPEKREQLISTTAFIGVLVNTCLLLVLMCNWLIQGSIPYAQSQFTLYQSNDYAFTIELLADYISFTYLLVGSFLTLLVTIYSRYYLHRENGYKRFFNTVLFFYAGYCTTVLSGNFETLFIGWEILGISSFLLIAFYRNRYLPVKNGIKVFSIYRIGDIGMLLAMWMSHHLWKQNISFIHLQQPELVHAQLQSHSLVGVFISLMILVAAAAKSAQLPFSSWLPRAMEGPTPSSAIFYGSLSVHIGAFLLLRTFVFWEYQVSVRIIIGILGLMTAIVTGLIARVQSSVKSQIAYASASQIGIIFLEIALGFQTLALFHFAGNAFLRTYQLLVSPSLVSYLIKEQFYRFQPSAHLQISPWRQKFKNAVYILSIQEFHLDWFMFKYVWGTLKNIGKKVSFLPNKTAVSVFGGLFGLGVYALYHQSLVPDLLKHYMSTLLAIAGMLMVLRAFVERKSIFAAWALVMLNHCFIVLAISFNEQYNEQHAIIYLSGVLISGSIGMLCLAYLKQKERIVTLNTFYGFAVPYPRMAFIFLLSCLGLAGFPITSTFVGEDLIYTHIHANQFILAGSVSLSLIADGITLIRMYARLFMGPSISEGYLSPFRSS